MTSPIVHPVILQYATGKLSALKAASILCDDVSVSEVILMLHDAGLSPPPPPPDRQQAEFAHARRILGLD